MFELCCKIICSNFLSVLRHFPQHAVRTGAHRQPALWGTGALLAAGVAVCIAQCHALWRAVHGVPAQLVMGVPSAWRWAQQGLLNSQHVCTRAVPATWHWPQVAATNGGVTAQWQPGLWQRQWYSTYFHFFIRVSRYWFLVAWSFLLKPICCWLLSTNGFTYVLISLNSLFFNAVSRATPVGFPPFCWVLIREQGCLKPITGYIVVELSLFFSHHFYQMHFYPTK